ncbi:MAG: Cof subfamily protein (haloacid dehalogenase superfamily) [Planctomycetota bacterium]|jgi:Cof subfamily protein (haloacid dehalogenase superfamily)
MRKLQPLYFPVIFAFASLPPSSETNAQYHHGLLSMELIIFDLDGTLLNRQSTISAYTSDTLKLLAKREIAYTVATGRTLHGARAILEGHSFPLPQAYKNGVMIWHPEQQKFSSSTTLTTAELENVVQACLHQGLTPFVFTLEADDKTTVYHPVLQSDADLELVRVLDIDGHVSMRALDELPADATVTHINSIGAPVAIKAVARSVDDEAHLVAYSGLAREGVHWHWLDIHHSDASKGGAIKTLKDLLGLERIICFGDSDNDLSMFAAADESYAPDNANETIKAVATAVIGHHDEDGIARFLRERFMLDKA